MKKKFLSIFLSCCLLFASIPFSVVSSETYMNMSCEYCGYPCYPRVQSFPCPDGGIIIYQCTKCMAIHEVKEPPKEHNYTESSRLEPTCEIEGHIEYSCTICNDTYTKELPPTGHQLGNEQTEYSCTSGGLVYAHCEKCNTDIILRTLPAGEHSYIEYVIEEATCYRTGYAEYSCIYCGYTYSATTPKKPHNMDKWYIENPTCTERGYKIRYCMNAGWCDYFEDAAIPATGHSFSEWSIEKECTCLENGKKVRTCTSCGKSEAETIVATGSHELGEWSIETEPTCTEAGLSSATCLNCKEKITEEIVPLGHSFGNWLIKSLPSDTDYGEKAHTCSVCNHTETILIEPGEYALGDASGDGIVNQDDYNLIVAISSGTHKSTPDEFSAADINQDGTVDGFDAIYFDLILNNCI